MKPTMAGLIVIDTAGNIDGTVEKKNDDDASSLFSDESIGSIFASDDEDENPASNTTKELELEFLMRDKLLEQLVQGMDPLYACVIRENEQADRKEKLIRVLQNGIIPDRTRRTSIMSSHSSNDPKRDGKEAFLLHEDKIYDGTQSISSISSHSTRDPKSDVKELVPLPQDQMAVSSRTTSTSSNSSSDPKSDGNKLVFRHQDHHDNETQITSISTHSSNYSKSDEKKRVFLLHQDSTSMSSRSTESDPDNKAGSAKRKSNSGKSFSFLMQNRLKGALILILNCIAYNGGEQIVRSFVVLFSHEVEFEEQTFLPAVMMICTFLILCVTGGIWDYVNDDVYSRIKRVMKKRLRQGKWDAVVMKWFRKHELIRTALNVLAFFTFVYCVYTFQEHIMSWAFDIREELFEGLPSVEEGVMTYPSMKLGSPLTEKEIQDAYGDETCIMNVLEQDELLQNLTRQDEEYLTSSMALDCYQDLMGDSTASVVTEATLFWYHMTSVIVAIVALRMMGHKFWSI